MKEIDSPRAERPGNHVNITLYDRYSPITNETPGCVVWVERRIYCSERVWRRCRDLNDCPPLREIYWRDVIKYRHRLPLLSVLPFCRHQTDTRSTTFIRWLTLISQTPAMNDRLHAPRPLRLKAIYTSLFIRNSDRWVQSNIKLYTHISKQKRTGGIHTY